LWAIVAGTTRALRDTGGTIAGGVSAAPEPSEKEPSEKGEEDDGIGGTKISNVTWLLWSALH
jgi:hypothetical protein